MDFPLRIPGIELFADLVKEELGEFEVDLLPTHAHHCDSVFVVVVEVEVIQLENFLSVRLYLGKQLCYYFLEGTRVVRVLCQNKGLLFGNKSLQNRHNY